MHITGITCLRFGIVIPGVLGLSLMTMSCNTGSSLSSALSSSLGVQAAATPLVARPVGETPAAASVDTGSGVIENQIRVGTSSDAVEIIEPDPLPQSSSPVILASADASSYSPGGSFNLENKPSVKPAVSSTLQPNIVGPGGVMMVRTTAYCHKEADSLPYGKLNAVGTELKYGGLVRSAAADWSRYPVGTRFRITGLPYEFVIDDYGSALVGTDTIDIYHPTFASMNAWGVRNVPIQVIEWGSFEMSHRILHGRRHVPHADHVREMLRSIESKAAASAALRRAEEIENFNKRA